MPSEEAKVVDEQTPPVDQPKSFGIFSGEKGIPSAPTTEEQKQEGQGPTVDASKKAEFEERSKLERELRERELELKGAREKLSEYDSFKNKRPKDILAQLGLDAMDVARDLLNSDEPEKPEKSEVEILREKYQALEQQLNGWQQQQLESQQSHHINGLIDEKQTPYLSFFREQGEDVAKQVLQVAIRRVQESKGQVIPEYKELIKEVEQSVRARYEPLKKLFGMNQPQTETPSRPEPKPTVKTLSNDLTSEPVPMNVRDMDDTDRQARFLEIMRESGWGKKAA